MCATTELFKDLHNLASKDNLYTGAVVEVSKDDNNTLSSLYFQTQEWKSRYAQYPELILIDATYKLTALCT